MSERVHRRAHAKVNLCLSVASPEPAGTPRAGWHRIASWFHCIDLVDDVALTALPAGAASTLRVAWAADAPRPSPIDWAPEKDLGMRALRLLERHAGRELLTAIEVGKRIPVGGGLGGGSSDAAAVLLGANALHGLGLTIPQLAALGASLGSDVPFFIDSDGTPRPALVTGFGESVERVSRCDAPLDLAVPEFGCPTPSVYAALDRGRGAAAAPADEGRVRRVIESARQGGPDGAELFNDLAGPAQTVEPRLAGLLASLREAGWDRTHVTGSGSCVFRLPPAGGLIPRRARTDDGLERTAILRVRLV